MQSSVHCPQEMPSHLEFGDVLHFTGELEVSQRKGHVMFRTEGCPSLPLAPVMPSESYQQECQHLTLPAQAAPLGESPASFPRKCLTQEAALASSAPLDL